MNKKNNILFNIIYIFIIIIFIPSHLNAQKYKYTVQDYINMYKDIAIDDMKVYGIPASIKLAQGIIESGAGNGELAIRANNHFGIKCKGDWNGDTVLIDDDEKNECFRKYNTAAESFRDHSEFLKNGKRYAFLFNLEITDYAGWAKGLKAAGYATAPDYAEKLIRVIEQNKLFIYDTSGHISPLAYNSTNSSSGINQQGSGKGNDFGEIQLSGHNRKTYIKNERSYIIAVKGDTPMSIGREFQTSPLFIRKFNDLKKDDKIKPGQMIFLEPKRNKAEVDFHIVKAGETMYGIAQFYGLKLKKLYKRNNMSPGEEPHTGRKLWLNKNQP